MLVATHCRKTLFAAGFIVALVASQIAAAQAAQNSSVTLKRTFKSGATEKYSNTSIMEMSGIQALPPQRITTTADVVMTYGKVEGGTAEVVSVTSNTKFDGLSAQLPPELMPKESRSTGKLDAQNMMTIDPAASGAGPAGDLTNALVQNVAGNEPVPQGVALPLKPVAPGDKWKTTMSAYEQLGLTGEIENTFVGEADFAGKPAYRITFEGHFKPGNTPGAQTDPLAAMMGAMTVDIRGEALLDKTDCSLLLVTTNTATSSTLAMGGQTMTMDQKAQTIQKRVN